jgi:thymidylate synthase (FAD)
MLYAARRQDTKNRQNSLDDLSDEVKREWLDRQNQNWQTSFAHYTWALDNNIAKECARMVLPLATSTTLYMSGSVRSWIHYIELRSGPETQKEHRDIAQECKSIFVQCLPDVSKALGW